MSAETKIHFEDQSSPKERIPVRLTTRGKVAAFVVGVGMTGAAIKGGGLLLQEGAQYMYGNNSEVPSHVEQQGEFAPEELSELPQPQPGAEQIEEKPAR